MVFCSNKRLIAVPVCEKDRLIFLPVRLLLGGWVGCVSVIHTNTNMLVTVVTGAGLKLVIFGNTEQI